MNERNNNNGTRARNSGVQIDDSAEANPEYQHLASSPPPPTSNDRSIDIVVISPPSLTPLLLLYTFIIFFRICIHC